MNLNKILVPIDYSDYSDRALQMGASFAGKFGAQLFILHVIPRAAPDLARAEDTVSWQSALDNPFVYYTPSPPPPPEGMITIDPIEMAENELKDHAMASLTGNSSAIPRIGVGEPAEEIIRPRENDAQERDQRDGRSTSPGRRTLSRALCRQRSVWLHVPILTWTRRPFVASFAQPLLALRLRRVSSIMPVGWEGDDAKLTR